ncbi:MAG: SMI1/KNR4 family protein [Acidobacteria bacterium]|nr:SMI1/KNR4 family protein [Acidobacteriota bacterium]MBV9186888.1 SMI1/KNR4 family protein [Acidobacteriota bacterium]
MSDDELIEKLKTLKRWFRKPRVRVSFPQTIAPVATDQELSDAEQRLGRTLPPLLRRIYREVGNGGFGPGFGMIGVGSGHKNPLGFDLVQNYRSLSAEDSWWPDWLVPLFDWGCASFTCLDLDGGELKRSIPDFDGGDDEPDNVLFLFEEKSLAAYLTRWLAGEQLSRPETLLLLERERREGRTTRSHESGTS